MESEVRRRLATILSADVVGYGRLRTADDRERASVLNAYREVTDTLVRQHRGRVVDFTGGAFLAEFPSAPDAVAAAVEIQQVIGARNTVVPSERRMDYRIGIHLGDVTAEGERLHGDAVEVAASLEGLAEPGGICISGEVRGGAGRRLDLDVHDLGERRLGNTREPVRVFRVEPPRGAFPEARIPTLVRILAGIGALLVAVAFVASWWLLAHRPASPSPEKPAIPDGAAPRSAPRAR